MAARVKGRRKPSADQRMKQALVWYKAQARAVAHLNSTGKWSESPDACEAWVTKFVIYFGEMIESGEMTLKEVVAQVREHNRARRATRLVLPHTPRLH